jgi:hypothetical protein
MAEVAYYFFWLFLDGAKNRANGASQLNFIIGSGAIIKLLFQIIIKEFIRIEVQSVGGQKYQLYFLLYLTSVRLKIEQSQLLAG